MSTLSTEVKKHFPRGALNQSKELASSSQLNIQMLEEDIKSLQLNPKDILENYNATSQDDPGCRIDLHGYSVQEAKKYIIDFIKTVYSNDNYLLIHVITGRGNHINSNGTRGVLFKNLQKWIKEPEISSLVQEVKKNQGAYLIVLNKKHKISKENPVYQLKESVLRDLANIGNKDAQFALGYRLLQKENKESQVWFLKAAQQEHFEAMNMLGYCHAMGRCAEYSIQEAKRWYTQAAIGNVNAFINLGTMYWSGEAGQVDIEQTIHCYKRAEKFGNVKAQRLLGIVLFRLKRYEEAFIWNDKASANNDLPAKVNLGCMYQEGLGIAKDESKAVDLFRAAAAGGIPEGKMRLGQAYLNGDGIDRNYKVAAKLFLEVGLSNHDSVGADCQFFLYIMYKNGLGFIPNIDIAERWLQLAAKNNNSNAVEVLKLKNSIVANEFGESALTFDVPVANIAKNLGALENKRALINEKKESYDEVNTNIKSVKGVRKSTGYCPYFSRYLLLTSTAVATVAISEYIRRNYSSM